MKRHWQHIAQAILLALWGTVATGCSDDTVVSPVTPDTSPADKEHVWQASLIASLPAEVADSGNTLKPDEDTRALFLGGNSGKKLYGLWDTTDEIKAYNKSGDYLGILTPNAAGHSNAKLNGSLTEVNKDFHVGDSLFLYSINREHSYDKQLGTIGDVSARFAYMTAKTTVSEVDKDFHYVSMRDTSFAYRQVYMRMRFFKNDGTRIRPDKFVITTESGKLVQTVGADGTVTYGDITILPEAEDGEMPGELFVALRNEATARDTYSFTARIGKEYYGSTDASQKVTAQLVNGNFYTLTRTLSRIHPPYISIVELREKLDNGDDCSQYVGQLITSEGNIFKNITEIEDDGTPMAIIAYIGPKGTADSSDSGYQALAMATDDAATGSEWNSNDPVTLPLEFISEADIRGIRAQTGQHITSLNYDYNDIAGEGNTLMMYGDDEGVSHPAAKAAREYGADLTCCDGISHTGWFLPSSGQWLRVLGANGLGQMSAVPTDTDKMQGSADKAPCGYMTNAMTEAGIEPMAMNHNHYWSSTEANEIEAMSMLLNTNIRTGAGGVAFLTMSKINSFRVRPFFAF